MIGIIYIFLIILALGLSFFFAGSETAFVAVNKVRVEVWRRRKDRAAGVILPFLKNPETFLYTTLIGNNISNTAFASLATVYFSRFLSMETTWVITTTLAVLLGEILPKTVFRSMADWVIRHIALPLKGFYYLFMPLYFLVSRLAAAVLFLLGHRKSELDNFFSERDIEILLRESREMMLEKGPAAAKFFTGILTLKKLQVRDAMVPRTEIVAVPRTTTIEMLTETISKHEHTKIPVFDESVDDIIGVVYLKDLLTEPSSLEEILHPVMFVPEFKRCSDLLAELKKRNLSIAIVIDEYGQTAGLITTEDLVEELFGEIEDEYDERENWIRKIEENQYRVNARIEIDRLNDALGIKLPEGDYDTLAGFLLTQFRHIPRRDETVDYAGITFRITSATRRKIQWVKVDLPSPRQV